jgi:hypothetical protein
MRRICITLLAAMLPCLSARAAVVINEIFYHAPEDLDDLQSIELHNTDDQPVDLSGWYFGKSPGYVFPKNTSIDAKSFLVVALNPEHFKQIYGAKALGPLEHPISRSGERLELFDAKDKRMDLAVYKDHQPWPAAADGYSASLERICPTSRGDLAQNWASSPLPAAAPKPAGTPGKPNTSYCATLPPIVSDVKLTPADPSPEDALTVQAKVANKGDIRGVTLAYRVVANGIEGPENQVLMDFDPATKLFRATIPPQKSNSIVRYRINALAAPKAERHFPAENDLCPMLSAYVHGKWEPAKIPYGLIINVRSKGPARTFREIFGGSSDAAPTRYRGGPSQPHPPRGTSAFVYVDNKTGKTTLFDYVNVVPRSNDRGFKVHFHKDHQLNGMSVVSMIFEGSERSLLAEHFAYDVYRRAGNPASVTDFIRLWVDGRMGGYHLMIEQPNKSFLRRNKLRDDGYMYKLLWYGSGIAGQHEKRSYPQTGHDDLVALVEKLRATEGDEQWKIIQQNFNVDEVATYFAVNMVLSHWDGYFNNYFTYHDLHGTKKWEMYPWDQDKTWGHHDGLRDDQIFFDMPLTYGMTGDVAPGGQTGGFFGGGNVQWWRRGGYFSGPLLANPQFRKIFLARVKYLLDKVYTEENYFPLIDALAERLKDDVKLRAKVTIGNPEIGLDQFEKNLESLKTHLTKRREFLLEQAELRELR